MLRVKLSLDTTRNDTQAALVEKNCYVTWIDGVEVSYGRIEEFGGFRKKAAAPGRGQGPGRARDGWEYLVKRS